MKRKGLFGLFLLCCSVADASRLIEQSAMKQETRIYSVVGIGLEYLRANGGQAVSLLSQSNDYFTGNSSYKASASLSLGGAVERSLNTKLLAQLGLAGTYNTSVKAYGTRWLFESPLFQDFNYNYQIQSTRVVATAKVLSNHDIKYHPYVSGELGAAFNHAFSYQEQTLIEEEIPIAPFASRTLASFTWGVGAGIDVNVRSNLRLGVGYQFVNLGQASLGLSSDQQTNETLTKTHIYDNQIRVQLTALL